MARKKAEPETQVADAAPAARAPGDTRAPAARAPGDTREPAMLGSDPTTLDTEERRRLRNQRRRYVRRQRYRRGRLQLVAEKDPKYHEELLELRRYNPQAFRKALTRWCLDNGVYLDRLYTSREQPAPLMERYGDSAAGDDED